MNTEEELKATLANLGDQVQTIRAKADAANRDYTDAESQQIDALYAEFQAVEVAIKTQELDSPNGRKTTADNPASPFSRTPSTDSLYSGKTSKSRFVNLATGAPIKSYRPDEPMSDLKYDGYAVGETIKAMALGDLSLMPKEIKNAVTAGDDTAGGYLTSTTLSNRFIDLARSQAVTVKAGAGSIQLGGGETKIGRLDTDPESYWRGETQAITASQPAFGTIVMRPKVVACLIPVSLEAAEDLVNGVQLIEQTVSRVLANALDQAALTGQGAASEPLGLSNNSAVNSRAAIGTPTNYVGVSNAVGDILSANYPDDVSNLSWILPPTIATVYDQLVTGITSDNTPLQPTEWVKKLQRYHTTSLSGSTDSPEQFSMLAGDFREMLYGFRLGGMRMKMFDAGTATDGADSWNAVSDMMVFIRAFIRVDVAVLRPTWFTHLSGVTR